RPDYALYVEKLLQPVQKQSLSQAVLETLAIVAYKQPVTRAEMELIRGVKCDYSVQALQNRGLIQEVGRKETLGRPILYGTTDAFLRHFGITSLEQLPKLDFQAAAKKMQEDAKKIEGSMDAETRA
ncbi:MAG: SMC-Scp complex subunit ScpB, partial [Clostridia bacterium]